MWIPWSGCAASNGTRAPWRGRINSRLKTSNPETLSARTKKVSDLCRLVPNIICKPANLLEWVCSQYRESTLIIYWTLKTGKVERDSKLSFNLRICCVESILKSLVILIHLILETIQHHLNYTQSRGQKVSISRSVWQVWHARVSRWFTQWLNPKVGPDIVWWWCGI